MLIAISGSQGTGKSTLIEALRDTYPSDIPKTSRSILKDWNVTLSEVNNNRELTIKFQEEILKRKSNDEAAFVVGDQVHITERTYADLFVYALVALGKDNEYSDWLDDYYERCRLAQSNYARVFYLTAGHFAPVHDGVRGSNKHYSKMVDLTMEHYTSRMDPWRNYGPGVIKIDMPDLKDRTFQVKQWIKATEKVVKKNKEQA